MYLEDDRVVQLLNDLSKLQNSNKTQRGSSWIPGHKLQEVCVFDSHKVCVQPTFLAARVAASSLLAPVQTWVQWRKVTC